MNGGILKKWIKLRIKQPKETPIIKTKVIMIKGFKFVFCNKYAYSIDEKAKTEPIERSIPPDNTTKVIPIAVMPATERSIHPSRR